MKKVNLLSKAEMKKVTGGYLPPYLCVFSISCGVTGDNDVIGFPNDCCGDLSEAEVFCRSRGYTGVYGCLDNSSGL